MTAMPANMMAACSASLYMTAMIPPYTTYTATMMESAMRMRS